MSEFGQLYVISTPIGNLGDITLRAIAILNEVDLIAAEDTRHSARLLQHHGISTKMVALHEHNEAQKKTWFVEQLCQGKNIGLISDAGTPLISDPGYQLVNICRQHDISVTPVPGACAVIAALSASGLATDAFQFLGFLPVKAVAREKAALALKGCDMTSIFYEAPRRVRDTLILFSEVFHEAREIVLAKELTKSFEHFVKGTADDVLQWLDQEPQREKGEFVLMVGPDVKDEQVVSAKAQGLLEALLSHLPAKKAAAVVAEHYQLRKNDLYKLALTLKEA